MMVTRRCTHCEGEIEVPGEGRVTCPICGLDLDLPRFAIPFDDAPAFFVGDSRLAQLSAEVPLSLVR